MTDKPSASECTCGALRTGGYCAVHSSASTGELPCVNCNKIKCECDDKPSEPEKYESCCTCCDHGYYHGYKEASAALTAEVKRLEVLYLQCRDGHEHVVHKHHAEVAELKEKYAFRGLTIQGMERAGVEMSEEWADKLKVSRIERDELRAKVEQIAQEHSKVCLEIEKYKSYWRSAESLHAQDLTAADKIYADRDAWREQCEKLAAQLGSVEAFGTMSPMDCDETVLQMLKDLRKALAEYKAVLKNNS